MLLQILTFRDGLLLEFSQLNIEIHTTVYINGDNKPDLFVTYNNGFLCSVADFRWETWIEYRNETDLNTSITPIFELLIISNTEIYIVKNIIADGKNAVVRVEKIQT